LPIAVWAVLHGRALPGGHAEPLLAHYGVQVLCLVAIPMMILCEAVANVVAHRIVPQFVSSGLVAPADRPRFVEIVRSVARLRDASLPWIFVVGAAIATIVFGRDEVESDSIVWSLADDGGIGFGGWWFLYVARPIYVALVFGWLWRLALVAVLAA